MGPKIRNQIQTTVLAGITGGLTDCLFQRGNTGFVLGVNSNIVVPLAAALRCRTVANVVNSCHRQRDKEGVCGAGDHFRNRRFHNDIKTDGKAINRCTTVSICLIHCDAAIVLNIGFHCVLYIGSIGFQSCSQCFHDLIGAIEPKITQGLVDIIFFIILEEVNGILAVRQTNCCQ